MARLYYECSADVRNSTEYSDTIRPYACTPDKYCLYCCCNSQCCILVQKRPPRHFWEAWYFWLGVALLAVFIISSVLGRNDRQRPEQPDLQHFLDKWETILSVITGTVCSVLSRGDHF